LEIQTYFINNFKNISINTSSKNIITKELLTSFYFNFPSTWSSFDKLVDIYIYGMFDIIKKYNIDHKKIFLTYYVPILIFLPFDIKNFFYPYFNLVSEKDITDFEILFNKYYKNVYDQLVHSDGIYYQTKPNNYNGLNSINDIILPESILDSFYK
jgi:hypothetical protein